MTTLTQQPRSFIHTTTAPLRLFAKGYVLLDDAIWKATDFAMKKLESRPDKTDLRRGHFQAAFSIGMSIDFFRLAMGTETKVRLGFPIIMGMAVLSAIGTVKNSQPAIKKIALFVGSWRTLIFLTGLYTSVHQTIPSDHITGQIELFTAGLYYLGFGSGTELMYNISERAKLRAVSY